VLRQNNGHLAELIILDNEIKSLIDTTKSLQVHKYGANFGVNLGLSVAPGGSHGKGRSGSIQFAKIVKSRPDLRRRIYLALSAALNKTFGSKLWYRRMMKLATRLNEDSGEQRTIPGLPATGIWYARHCRKEAVHCDENVVGATFLFTTQSFEGGLLGLLSPSGKLVTHCLKAGEILAGKWAENPHCNLGVTDATVNERTSWTIYFDRRVFSNKYAYIEPVGFANN
jgi:hypothetical protein